MLQRSIVTAFALVVVMALLLLPLPFEWSLGWRSTLLDLGHLPLFAILTGFFTWWLKPRLIIPVFFVGVLAGIAELLQHFVGRTASWSDFVNGVLAASAAACVIRAVRSPHSLGRLMGCPVLAMACLAWPLARMGPVLYDAIEGYEDFPTLAGFRTNNEMRRWYTQQADIQRSYDASGEWSAQITFRPGRDPYPGATLMPIVHDLSDYRRLCLHVTLKDEPLDLVTSVRGGPADHGHTSHYQTPHHLEPGEQVLRIDLNSAASFAKPNGLALTEVWFVQLFVVRPDTARTIHVRRIWVEK